MLFRSAEELPEAVWLEELEELEAPQPARLSARARQVQTLPRRIKFLFNAVFLLEIPLTEKPGRGQYKILYRVKGL